VSGVPSSSNLQVHHVLGEIIQGGLVLETNINEIATCGECQISVSPTLH
jgi:hypothetical protein